MIRLTTGCGTWQQAHDAAHPNIQPRTALIRLDCLRGRGLIGIHPLPLEAKVAERRLIGIRPLPLKGHGDQVQQTVEIPRTRIVT